MEITQAIREASAAAAAAHAAAKAGDPQKAYSTARTTMTACYTVLEIDLERADRKQIPDGNFNALVDAVAQARESAQMAAETQQADGATEEELYDIEAEKAQEVAEQAKALAGSLNRCPAEMANWIIVEQAWWRAYRLGPASIAGGEEAIAEKRAAPKQAAGRHRYRPPPSPTTKQDRQDT